MSLIKQYICECGKIFENAQSYNGHKSHCTIHLEQNNKIENFINRKTKYLEVLAQNRIAAHNASIDKSKILLTNWIAEKHVCEKCGKVMTEKFGSGRFCSRACANSRTPSVETKDKISKSLQSNYDDSAKQSILLATYYGTQPKLCKCCGNVIPYELRHRKCCSNECVSKLQQEGSYLGGHKAAATQVKRSKNEVYFCELCENYFKKVRHNEPIFNGWDADIIIDDIKYAILWNGPWHYRKITKKHSVKQVQNRDAIKVTEIKKCGYTPYIIKDDGKYNKAFVETQFNNFIESIT